MSSQQIYPLKYGFVLKCMEKKIYSTVYFLISKEIPEDENHKYILKIDIITSLSHINIPTMNI